MGDINDELLSSEQRDYIIALGRDADALKKDNIFKTLCDTLYSNLFRQWLTADTPEEREHIHATVRGMQSLETVIDAAIGHGKVEAEKRSEELERFKQSVNK